MTSPWLKGAVANHPLYALYALYGLFRFAQFLLEVPTVQMVEVAACHQFLNRKNDVIGTVFEMAKIPDSACKAVPVQEQISRVIGWKMSFDAIPGMPGLSLHP